MTGHFRYLRDGLFLSCLFLYLVNRWVLKTLVPNVLSQSYLNDLLCIPFWVPIMLFGMRASGLRRNDSPPAAHEILIPLLLWSLLFEFILPYWILENVAISDFNDVLCYTLGAFVAGVYWKFAYTTCPTTTNR